MHTSEAVAVALTEALIVLLTDADALALGDIVALIEALAEGEGVKLELADAVRDAVAVGLPLADAVAVWVVQQALAKVELGRVTPLSHALANASAAAVKLFG